MICPNSLFKNHNLISKWIITTEDVLRKKMSYENIFRTLIQYERVKKILFNEEQLILIENLPKIKFSEVKDNVEINKSELTKNVHLINYNSSDKINSKLLKIFK